MQELLRDIRRMVVFTAVVQAGSFTRAADVLGLGKSVISEHVSQLESELGSRLLSRTTRKLALTEAGEQFYRDCLAMLESAEQAHSTLKQLQIEPQGKLRITTTVDFGTLILAPMLGEFQARYPKLRLDLILQDEKIDLISAGIDVGLRIGWPKDSQLRYRKLASTQLKLCAGKAYLKRMGRPQKISDLNHHEWIALTVMEQPNRLQIQDAQGQEHQINFTPTFSSNSPVGVHALACQNRGIARIAVPLIEEGIRQGLLEYVLPDCAVAEMEIYALYPYHKQVPLKVRCFLDFLAKQLKQS